MSRIVVVYCIELVKIDECAITFATTVSFICSDSLKCFNINQSHIWTNMF